MALETKIQWATATWNPWYGCHKVSPACKYCYMYRDMEKFGMESFVVQKSKTKFFQPKTWKDPQRIFTCSWSDFFHPDADKWRGEAWEVIRKTPQHTYLILTKRPERIEGRLPKFFAELKNVWLGVSIEDRRFMHRALYLKDLPCTRFASFEPLLGDCRPEIYPIVMKHCLDWAIIGGESGNDTGKYRYRKMDIDHFEKLLNALQKNSIPTFVKQLGTYQAKRRGYKDRFGGDITEWPEKYQIRQMP